jgi:hypothetical protein
VLLGSGLQQLLELRRSLQHLRCTCLQHLLDLRCTCLQHLLDLRTVLQHLLDRFAAHPARQEWLLDLLGGSGLLRLLDLWLDAHDDRHCAGQLLPDVPAFGRGCTRSGNGSSRCPAQPALRYHL